MVVSKKVEVDVRASRKDLGSRHDVKHGETDD